MATATISITGNRMDLTIDREKGTVQNSDVFVVKCGIDGVLAMIEAGPVNSDRSKKDSNGRKKYAVSIEQYQKLLDSGTAHTLINAPPSYKPPQVKLSRK